MLFAVLRFTALSYLFLFYYFPGPEDCTDYGPCGPSVGFAAIRKRFLFFDFRTPFYRFMLFLFYAFGVSTRARTVMSYLFNYSDVGGPSLVYARYARSEGPEGPSYIKDFIPGLQNKVLRFFTLLRLCRFDIFSRRFHRDTQSYFRVTLVLPFYLFCGCLKLGRTFTVFPILWIHADFTVFAALSVYSLSPEE